MACEHSHVSSWQRDLFSLRVYFFKYTCIVFRALLSAMLLLDTVCPQSRTSVNTDNANCCLFSCEGKANTREFFIFSHRETATYALYTPTAKKTKTQNMHKIKIIIVFILFRAGQICTFTISRFLPLPLIYSAFFRAELLSPWNNIDLFFFSFLPTCNTSALAKRNN